MSDLRVGVIGCGEVAQIRYLPAIAAMSGVALAAIVDKNPATLAQLAPIYGPSIATAADYAEVAGEIDAVVITTPPAFHEPLCLAAIADGKHVLVEKPLTLDFAEAVAIWEAASKAAVAVMPMPFNAYPGLELARELVASGTLGRVVSAQATHVHYGPMHAAWFFQKDNCDVLGDTAVYPLSRLVEIVGPIAMVTGRLTLRRPIRELADGRTIEANAGDTAVIMLEFKNGAVGAINVSSAVGGLGLSGTRGYKSGNAYVDFAIFMEGGWIATDGKQRLTVYTQTPIRGIEPQPLPGGTGISFDEILAQRRDDERNLATWSGFRVMEAFLAEIGTGRSMAKLAREVHVIEVLQAVRNAAEMTSITTAAWF